MISQSLTLYALLVLFTLNTCWYMVSSAGLGEKPSLLVEDHLVVPGQSASLTCSKPGQVTDDIVWDRESQAGQGVIAIGGVIQGDPAKYGIQVSGDTQTLTVKDILLDDDDMYRCYTVFQTDYDYYNISVVSEYSSQLVVQCIQCITI